MAPGALPVALLGPGHRWLYCEGGTCLRAGAEVKLCTVTCMPPCLREGVLSARPWTAVILCYDAY